MPVLDTSCCIDVLRGRRKAVQLLGLLQQHSAPVGATVHTIYELYHGVGLAQDRQAEQQSVEGFLRSLHVFSFEPEVGRLAGLLQADLSRQGRAIDVMDLFIACTALHHGEPVITRNRRHFERISGLEVLSY